MEFFAYFDTQGFYIDGYYHPAECTILTDDYLVHVKVKKTCDCAPTSRDTKQLNYLKYHHHGFQLDDVENGIEYSDLKVYLIDLGRHAKETHQEVACRSKEAQMILDRFEVPNININRVFSATFNTINLHYKPCYYHSYPNPAFVALSILFNIYENICLKSQHSLLMKLIKELNKLV